MRRALWIAVVAIVTISGIAAASQLRAYLAERRAGSNEAAAIGLLELYGSAQRAFYEASGAGFAHSLDALIPFDLPAEVAAAQIDGDRPPVPINGYLLSEIFPPCGLLAFPAEPGVTGDRAFFTDESGLVRFQVVAAGSSLLPMRKHALAEPVALDDDALAVARGDAKLAIDSLRALGDAAPNEVISPRGLSVALAACAAGADGPTRDEIERALGSSLPEDRALSARAAIATALRDAAGDALAEASGLFRTRGFALDPAYAERACSRLGASMEDVDFAGDPAGAAAAIRTWSLAATRGRMMAPIAAVDPRTRLLFASAVAFHGRWRSPFDRTDSKPAPFEVPGTSTPTALVPTMNQTGSFGYLDEDGVQVLRVPCKESSVALLLVLPRAVDGLPKLVAALDAGRLVGWIDGASETLVETHVPRFSIERTRDLRAPLARIGVERVFQPGAADLSRMGPAGRGAWLSTVEQLARIDVDEEGAIAIAYTQWNPIGGGGDFGGSVHAPPPPPVVRADHPFLFALVETRSREVLFIGRVGDPR